MMGKLIRKLALPLCMALLVCHAQGQIIRIVGASTVILPVKDATDALKKEQGITLQIFPVMSTNVDKIRALGENQADVALIARPLTAADRAPYPEIDFNEIQFGDEAAALAVSRDVWDAGVRSITRDQAKGIYEGKIKNWKEIGGPDMIIVGFTPDKARGIWACYVQWLYDDPTLIQDNDFPQTKSDDDAKSYLESSSGSVTPVSMLYAATNKLHVLAIKNDDGKLIQPTIAAIADHSYPLARPLIMVVKGRPLGFAWAFVQFMTGDSGQAFVHKYNYLTIKELGIAPPSY